jgi:hypothetical protein
MHAGKTRLQRLGLEVVVKARSQHTTTSELEHRRSSSTWVLSVLLLLREPSTFLSHSACEIGCAVIAEEGGSLRGISSAQRGFKSDASYPCTQIGEVLDVPRKKGRKWS